MKRRFIFGIVILLFGFLLFFVPFNMPTHVCLPKSDGSFMKCHWMGEVVRMLGFLLVVFGVLIACYEKLSYGVAICVLLVGMCLICLQFFVIGTCKAPMMPCNVYTKPTVLLLSGLIIISSFIYLFISRKKYICY